ncbi:MAG: diaminopimelate epimerase [Algoriphagus sp.]
MTVLQTHNTMELIFYKYQGTGNDFVMIDDRQKLIDTSDLSSISRLCDRRFGIGADGLILIRNHPDYDFEMIYFNADGSQSMCGNGARCAVAFADFLEIIKGKTHFLAIDGPHEAAIDSGKIHLKMADASKVQSSGADYFLNTGSPHHIRFVENASTYPVFEEGKHIRYDEAYSPAGTNVNFVEKITGDQIFVRTYERGVEDETLSCGTGVTAAALAFAADQTNAYIKINTLGGQLSVKFNSNPDGSFSEIWLIGPAEQVYQGKIIF